MKIELLVKTVISLAIFCLGSSPLIADTSFTSTYKSLVDDSGNISKSSSPVWLKKQF